MRSRVVLVLAVALTVHAQQRDETLSNIGIELSTTNNGFVIAVDKQPQLDPEAVRVNFEAVSNDTARADVMRVVLQSLEKLAPHHPSLVEFASNARERLFLDGKDITDIVFQYTRGKPLVAWRMFAERATKPDGSRVKLPDGVLARTTASFSIVDEIIDGSGKTSKTSETRVDASIRKADKWHPADTREHGEVVSLMLQQARSKPLRVNDSSRLDAGQVNDILKTVSQAAFHGLTEAKIALQQQEQGGKAEVPPGSSELLGLQLKFKDIFGVRDDELLMPLTSALALYAPESSFAGLTVYGKHREIKTRIIGKMKIWYSGVSTYSIGESYYATAFETEKGYMRPGGNEILLRWGDIKDKLAFDMSDGKLEEDAAMQRQALSGGH